MLTTYPIATTDQPSAFGPAFWVDLVDPTPQESERVARECGVQVPSRESLQEIETSSRTRAEGDVLYMSMPLALQDGTRGLAPVPLGFILSPQRLITVRYSEVHAFARVMERARSDPKMTSASTFVALIDGMVDFDADMLEKLSSDLAVVSGRAFGQSGAAPVHDKHYSRALRNCVNAVGTVGERLSRIRETLLGLQRIIGFVSESAREGQLLLPDLRTHLKTARQDVASLVEFESHLSGKTQFLLDAVLGFINTEQNEIFKVLTIVSVVGIPPTLIASMYGMNFHYMPELAWRWGYPYGLGLIALSTLIPIIWFKRRGWW
jgi:magnesium transporter